MLRLKLFLDRTAFEIASMDERQSAYEDWKHASVEERLAPLERLREIHYCAKAAARLQRLFVVVERPSS